MTTLRRARPAMDMIASTQELANEQITAAGTLGAVIQLRSIVMRGAADSSMSALATRKQGRSQSSKPGSALRYEIAYN